MDIHLLVGAICVALALGILIDAALRTQNMSIRMRRERNMMLSSGIVAAIVAAYPLLFDKVVGINSVAILGLAWTTAMLLYDATAVMPETAEEDQATQYSTSMGANVLVGACWATGSLIHIIANKSSAHGAKVLLFSNRVRLLCTVYTYKERPQ